MSKVIIYSNPDGSVSVVYPTGEIPIEQVWNKDTPGIDNPKGPPVIVDLEIIPKDRYFRDAWKQDVTSIKIDMEKAKIIHMNRIRKSRDKELAKLDVEWTKKAAQKKNQEADAIETQRQTLRDIPISFDLSVAKTPDELKALWPNILPKE